jgi:hypothetical protein
LERLEVEWPEKDDRLGRQGSMAKDGVPRKKAGLELEAEGRLLVLADEASLDKVCF